MRPLRVAVIGAGFFAGFHIDAWKRLPRADLVAVVDQDIARAETHGVPAYPGIELMLADHELDIIDIATPPSTHASLIRQALFAKPRVVICQKPFCGGDIEIARQVLNDTHDIGIPLVVHENFRFQPWYRLIKAEIEAGRIGDVLNATFRLRPGDGQGPDAYLHRQPYFRQMPRFLIHETGVHWVDVFRYLLGEPETVLADLRRLNTEVIGEDAGTFILGFPNGVRALFDGNRLLDHAAENHRLTMGECLIEGTKGTLAFGGDGIVKYRPFGSTEQAVIGGVPSTLGFGGDCVMAFQNHVLDGVLNGTSIENRGHDYLKNLKIVESIYLSSENGQRLTLPTVG